MCETYIDSRIAGASHQTASWLALADTPSTATGCGGTSGMANSSGDASPLGILVVGAGLLFFAAQIR